MEDVKMKIKHTRLFKSPHYENTLATQRLPLVVPLLENSRTDYPQYMGQVQGLQRWYYATRDTPSVIGEYLY